VAADEDGFDETAVVTTAADAVFAAASEAGVTGWRNYRPRRRF
jgi:hypothetical protein